MDPALRVAVQKLNHRHRDDIARHLIELPAADRFLRFGRGVHGGVVEEAMTDQFALIDCLLKQQSLWLAQAGLKSWPDKAEALDERRGTAGAAKTHQGQVP